LHKHLNRDQPVLKRLPALQPLSREHHHALLLCWRIKLGLARKVEIARINDYAWHFWQGYLQAHFRLEETQVFPELGNEHPMVQRAVKEHKQIEGLFTSGMRTETDFELLETLLERHIRFEERVLFPEMQLQLLPDALDRIAAANRHTEIVNDWPDKFWR
jgi:hemerythrin-like domain-containing protein